MPRKKQHLVAASHQRDNGDRVLHVQGTREELTLLKSALAAWLDEAEDRDYERAAQIGEKGYLIGVWEVQKTAPKHHLAAGVEYALAHPLEVR